MTRRMDGPWTWTATNKDKAFESRLGWIGQCGSIAGGTLHHYDYIKANTSRYIFEVHTVYAAVKYNWGWGMGVIDLPAHSCYFLGSFPNYWNVQNRRVVFAHDLMTPNAYPIGQKPTLLEHYVSDYETQAFKEIADTFGKQNLTDYFYPQFIPTERYATGAEEIKATRAAIDKALFEFTTFYKPYELEHYLLQSFPLDARQAKFRACVNRTWPTRPKEYKPIQPPPTQAPPVTATPIEEIPLPLPEAAPAPAPAPGQMGLGMDISLGIKPTGYTNTLELTLTIYEALI